MEEKNLKDKYFLMTRDASGNQYITIGANTYLLAQEIPNVDDAIVTHVEVIPSHGMGGSFGKGGADMVLCEAVETRMLDPETDDILDLGVYKAYLFSSVDMFDLLVGEEYKKVFFRMDGGYEEVEPFRYEQYEKGRDMLAEKMFYIEVLDQLRRKNGYVNIEFEEILPVLIRNYRSLDLHCCDKLHVYGECLLEIVYPGWYRDSCNVVAIKEDGLLEDIAILGTLRNASNQTASESMAWVRKYMDINGISVGDDSGDEVPGATPEQRALLTTFRCGNGVVISMLKAETFRPELLQDAELMQYVCKGIADWSGDESRENPYYNWMD